MPPTVSFKSPRIENEYKLGMGKFFPFALKQIVTEALEKFEAADKAAIFTSIWRSWVEDKQLEGTGIHCLWRATDLHADMWGDPVIQGIADELNAEWVYDSTRPAKLVALYAPHGNGPHLHLQVCGNTERRDGTKTAA